jgi:hypothetical protein
MQQNKGYKAIKYINNIFGNHHLWHVQPVQNWKKLKNMTSIKKLGPETNITF